MDSNEVKQSYGEVRLKRGTRLYMCSVQQVSELPTSALLRLCLHPSEGLVRHPNEEFCSDHPSYVTTIELCKDVSLLWMIEKLTSYFVYSSFRSHSGYPYHPPYVTDAYSRIWLSHLEKEHLEGWMTPRENRYAVEVAIRNHPTLLKFVESKPLRFDWRSTTIDDTDQLIPKRWGTEYPIATDMFPATLILSRRFESQLNIYRMKQSVEDPGGTTFLRLLNTAEIECIDAPVQHIKWSSRVGDGDTASHTQIHETKESVLAEKVLQRTYEETEDSTEERN
jgi:hypothetical protein